MSSDNRFLVISGPQNDTAFARLMREYGDAFAAVYPNENTVNVGASPLFTRFARMRRAPSVPKGQAAVLDQMKRAAQAQLRFMAQHNRMLAASNRRATNYIPFEAATVPAGTSTPVFDYSGPFTNALWTIVGICGAVRTSWGFTSLNLGGVDIIQRKQAPAGPFACIPLDNFWSTYGKNYMPYPLTGFLLSENATVKASFGRWFDNLLVTDEFLPGGWAVLSSPCGGWSMKGWPSNAVLSAETNPAKYMALLSQMMRMRGIAGLE